MADQLQQSQGAAPSNQNVVVVEGNGATGSMQAPSSTGSIWFAFSVGSGNATLNVNFNGQTYPNVPPGSYTVQTSQLNLDVKVSGSSKLAWAPA